MEPTVESVVAKGVQYMDTYGPADWRSRINLDTLDIESCTDCILGQVFSDPENRVFGGYMGHMSTFRKNVGEYTMASDYGFSWDELDPEEITEEWKRVLSA